VLVPLEPTDRMIAIGQNLRYQSAWSISAIYREMLAAAPQPVVRGPLEQDKELIRQMVQAADGIRLVASYSTYGAPNWSDLDEVLAAAHARLEPKP
jgi:hypothetical protein